MRFFIAALALVTLAACEQGREGDRCNPSLSHDDCNSGLSCQQPTNCPESYCCPIDGTESSNPFCQPGCNGGDIAICKATDACVDAPTE